MTKISDQSGHSATVAQTQGVQGIVSTVVLEDEKILHWTKKRIYSSLHVEQI